MTRTSTHLIILGLGMLLSFSVLADRIPFARPGDDAARIVGQPGVPSNDIYPVRFIAIDGVNLPNRGREVIWLEPGSYTLTVSAEIRNPSARRFTRDRHETGYNSIEVVVEAGKTYHIGMKYDREQQRTPYSTVLYRITD